MFEMNSRHNGDLDIISAQRGRFRRFFRSPGMMELKLFIKTFVPGT